MPLNIPFLREKAQASPTENTVGEPIDHAITTSSSEKENAMSTGIEASDVEANRKLDLYRRTHKWDPNLGDDTLDEIATVTALNDSNAQSKVIDRVIDNSPYPEVRAAVRNYDEDLPASTFRAWTIGMFLTTIGSGLNSLFSLRAPAIIITSVVALLVSYPIGVAWAKIIPARTFNIFGLKWNTNPGPFNVKEHVLIVVMANASFGNGVAYFTDTIQALKAFYHTDYAVVTHTALFHGKHIWTVIRDSRGELDDVHTRMMRKYKNAPWWWYITLLAVCVALCLVTALAWPTHLTWWALLLALFISLVMTIPIGVVQATTNIQLGLNVFTEYIIGYMLPGRPLAMMLFKTYGYITMVQALSFVQDLKLGHYMKVPPRSLFWGQLVATMWSCMVQLCVQIWALDNIADICQPHQSNRFTCPQGRVFFGASVIWGVIGPARMFSGNALYSSLQYFWIVGALSPLLFYALARIFPRSNARFLSAPVIFGSVLYIPPATPLNYFAWCMVGFVFQKFIRNRFRGWWMRFNYITSASLDAGLAISTIVVIAAINLTGSKFPSWWGNTGSMETLDNLGEAIRQPLAEGETFGPPTW
ncbi:Small oligopeptide transporter [Trichophyton interdigitale]|uniref:Small oligopeptide transporter n=1 Tax=Trichophyton interdigitale TaxID=101480 RepID=A0A9P4YMC3_9EURO|nr:Small oligopeptide transporter [Trichophyton interdigitale]KAF3901299.1 Small oligopeptide transporter [Trichophyton interdigitale]KAG8212397.1 Small oligopeptide transporter [Trichophyton interdigitale]